MKNIISILFLLNAYLLFGQQASIAIDKESLRIGEQALMSIRFEYTNPNGHALVVWPEFDEELTKGVEIIKKSIDKDQLLDSVTNTYVRSQELVITSFEAGNYTIPAQKIKLGDSTYLSNSTKLKVTTVEVDTSSKSIFDIKPIYTIDYPFSERSKDWIMANWDWLAIIALVILIFFVWRYIQSNKVDQVIEEPKVIIPAHILALEKLELLLKNEAWQSSEKKDYYSELTDTVRTYLENRFEIHAMEQTTREIINDLKAAAISEDDKLYLRKILREADMVKFAKFKPTDEDALTYLNNSIDFVKRTKKEVNSDGN